MSMRFEELDETTRQYMLDEFEVEEASGNSFRSAVLSAVGLNAFPDLMRAAIQTGNEEMLTVALLDSALWRTLNARGARVNVQQSASQLALTEFNTWYVRGLCKRLMAEGIEQCQIYRAEMPKFEIRTECSCMEDQKFSVEIIYRGHRAKYWPTRNSGALSIPSGPSCHHTIRRA